MQLHEIKMSSNVKFPNTLNLPNLPVPTLKQTLKKYLKSVEPFLNPEELENTKTIVQKFEDNEGPTLQNYLENKAQNSENWLSEWWDNITYFDRRAPLPGLSTQSFVFPLQRFKEDTECLEYAAKLVLGAIDFKFKIDNDLIPQEKLGKKVIDMNQYKKIFGTCRIPKPKRDELKFNPNSRHIIVASSDEFYRLEVITADDRIRSFQEILRELMVVKQKSGYWDPCIGLLTFVDRNNWSDAYKILSKDPRNRKSLDAIEGSLFLLCLDIPPVRTDDDDLTSAAHQCIHGDGVINNSANRWFDKTIQFIVSLDGVVGLIHEHTSCEEQPIAALADHVLDYIESDAWKSLPDTGTGPHTHVLKFKIENDINGYILCDGSRYAHRLAYGLELKVLHFKEFGKDFLKSQKLIPDSFIQMAIQYTFYRIYKMPGAQYESASTKQYIHGRTEAIRSCSVESIAFVKTMLDEAETANDAEKIEALKTAINAHKNYVNDARNGFGVDRHLLGLKLAAEELNEKQPEIFTDVAFTRSSAMRVCTSRVDTKCFSVMVYKPRIANGYGCSYNLRPNEILFGISCFSDNQETDVMIFKNTLHNSLMDMHDLFASSNPELTYTLNV